ncbi:hypothetical protein EX30DRAFT_348984 [Ascodesmis nigricans]|uniref:Uncharacterized protein n=1 Tax=Ascodesmis nigricans TaxID=341454 RepID=A0A4S2MX15_9PEZI|nr:hypothetical protein EX30DRAFT_348984 [Ascodesmis nigricans]
MNTPGQLLINLPSSLHSSTMNSPTRDFTINDDIYNASGNVRKPYPKFLEELQQLKPQKIDYYIFCTHCKRRRQLFHFLVETSSRLCLDRHAQEENASQARKNNDQLGLYWIAGYKISLCLGCKNSIWDSRRGSVSRDVGGRDLGVCQHEQKPRACAPGKSRLHGVCRTVESVLEGDTCLVKDAQAMLERFERRLPKHALSILRLLETVKSPDEYPVLQQILPDLASITELYSEVSNRQFKCVLKDGCGFRLWSIRLRREPLMNYGNHCHTQGRCPIPPQIGDVTVLYKHLGGDC